MALKYYALLALLFMAGPLQAFKIDRVIVATDLHENYVEFWPLVAKTWERIVGIKPTLVFVAPAGAIIDETIGEVIRFEPIEGIPTAFQAQVLRLLIPAFFKDDFCLISDMDMIPLNYWYFVGSVARCGKNCFVVYRDKAYDPKLKRYPMCYNAARGAVFGEIFKVTSMESIREIIKQWFSYDLGWSTDEQMLYRCLQQWQHFKTRCIRLGHDVERRIDRIRWGFDSNLLKSNYYIDVHLLRPYHIFKAQIDALIALLDLDKELSLSLEDVHADKRTLYRLLHPKKSY